MKHFLEAAGSPHTVLSSELTHRHRKEPLTNLCCKQKEELGFMLEIPGFQPCFYQINCPQSLNNSEFGVAKFPLLISTTKLEEFSLVLRQDALWIFSAIKI